MHSTQTPISQAIMAPKRDLYTYVRTGQRQQSHFIRSLLVARSIRSVCCSSEIAPVNHLIARNAVFGGKRVQCCASLGALGPTQVLLSCCLERSGTQRPPQHVCTSTNAEQHSCCSSSSLHASSRQPSTGTHSYRSTATASAATAAETAGHTGIHSRV